MYTWNPLQTRNKFPSPQIKRNAVEIYSRQQITTPLFIYSEKCVSYTKSRGFVLSTIQNQIRW